MHAIGVALLDTREHSAVDEIGGADAVGRLVGAKKHEEVGEGEFLGAAETPDWRVLVGHACR
jgi:hypothetical protein